jgi:hypothetical protein
VLLQPQSHEPLQNTCHGMSGLHSHPLLSLHSYVISQWHEHNVYLSHFCDGSPRWVPASHLYLPWLRVESWRAIAACHTTRMNSHWDHAADQ